MEYLNKFIHATPQLAPKEINSQENKQQTTQRNCYHHTQNKQTKHKDTRTAASRQMNTREETREGTGRSWHGRKDANKDKDAYKD